MRLENVKVGDRVWIVKLIRGVRRRTNLCTVIGLTPKQIVTDHFHARYWRVQGRRYHPGMAVNYGDGNLQQVATPKEIAEWEAEQAQKKADAEAAQATQQQAYQERQGRLSRLIAFLQEYLHGTIDTETGNIIFEGHVFRIEETEQ